MSEKRNERPSEPTGPPAQEGVHSTGVSGQRLSAGQRWLSFAELILRSAIVLGHNVCRVIPNEVPILFVLGLISVRIRDAGWKAMGLSWPIS